MQGFFQSGSFGHGTNIPLHSDVDRFAVFPDHALPPVAIRALWTVGRALTERFPTTPGIRIEPPAVIIPFGTDGRETTEIIPAILHSMNTNGDVYRIPNPGGGPNWVLSSPKLLRSYIDNVDDAFDNQLKPIIRVIKSWKYFRKVPLQSVYLELVSAKIAQFEGIKSTSWFVANLMHFLRQNMLPEVDPPLQVGQSIAGPTSPKHQQQAMNQISLFSMVATKAVVAELEWRVEQAFNIWRRLFGAGFPSAN